MWNRRDGNGQYFTSICYTVSTLNYFYRTNTNTEYTNTPTNTITCPKSSLAYIRACYMFFFKCVAINMFQYHSVLILELLHSSIVELLLKYILLISSGRKYLHPRLASLSKMGSRWRTPLKPLNTTILCYLKILREASIGSP